MGRPALGIGTHGNITCREITLDNGRTVVEARCWYRAADGSRARLKRSRKSKTAAEQALKDAVVEASKQVHGESFTPHTRMNLIIEQWFADEIELAVAEGRKSPRTGDAYRSVLDAHLLPAWQELQALEVRTPRCSALMNTKRRAGVKDDLLAQIRNVGSQVCSYAVRHGAMDRNPWREVGRLERAEDPKPPRALTAAERLDVLAKLDTDPKARRFDLAAIFKAQLATGKRVAEILGCAGDDVLLDDPADPRLRVAHRTTRVKGQGTVRRAIRGGTKGKKHIVHLPMWSVPLFRALKLASGGPGPLFGDPFGRWRGTDSVVKPLRQVLDQYGYDWLTSHNARDTVANFLDDAGLSPDQIAVQLGQADSRITKKHYLEDKATNEVQVKVLEGMM